MLQPLALLAQSLLFCDCAVSVVATQLLPHKLNSVQAYLGAAHPARNYVQLVMHVWAPRLCMCQQYAEA